MTYAAIVLLTNTYAAARNARKLLSQAHGLNYFQTKPLGFVGGVALLWDSSKVYITCITKETIHVSFVISYDKHQHCHVQVYNTK